FSDDAILSLLRQANLCYRKVRCPAESAASLLAEGRVIGWFQGRTEFGPRALGNRSILADPRIAENRDRVNALKGRDGFRPLAPAILEEHAYRFFEISRPAPFMLSVHRIKSTCAASIPAVRHVDGTARVQTVARADNPLFYRLIECFCRLTGV